MSTTDSKAGMGRRVWTNHSVLKFSHDGDPVEEVCLRARQLALRAIDKGWQGPPFDPFKLAEICGLPVVPRGDVADARLVPSGHGSMSIEFNPERPHGRTRFSIAHEIAHTLFPDCAERVRNRGFHMQGGADEWQLETLCNIAAAELLMPAGSLPEAAVPRISIDEILAMRRRYEVSLEAMLLRVIRRTRAPAFAFAASAPKDRRGQYSVDYTVAAPGLNYSLPPSLRIPRKTLLSGCSAVGFTAKGEEEWSGVSEALRIECVGLPPYPGLAQPRVAGFALIGSEDADAGDVLSHVLGDVMSPRGEGGKMIVHVVNDKTVNWGGPGFAPKLGRRWPLAQSSFRSWVAADPRRRALGNVHFVSVADGLVVASMVCQHGYGASDCPRIKYGALLACLEEVRARALKDKVSVHMPRIGTGQGGGSWEAIEDLVRATLCASGVGVTVYSLPNRHVGEEPSRVQGVPRTPT